MLDGKVPGSYRDPNGYLFFQDQSIYRYVLSPYQSNWEAIQSCDIFQKASDAGYLIATQKQSLQDFPCKIDNCIGILKHERLPYISYPYEWSFIQLKQAALHHLQFHLFLLKHGFTLSDASAYNVQFFGSKPVFIDALSIIEYQEGQLWEGYKQFCEQFLNPLIFSSKKKIAFNSQLRSQLEGIPTHALLAMLSWRETLDWRIYTFLKLQQFWEKKAEQQDIEALLSIKQQAKPLSLDKFKNMLKCLYRWIESLELSEEYSAWSDYAEKNTYCHAEKANKKQLIQDFIGQHALKKIADLGCNSGDYSEAAIDGGASYVVGFDFDPQVLVKAFMRAHAKQLPYLPLWLDAANPSPAQGWKHQERESFAQRANFDGIIALAFEHHLAIAKNIPLTDVVTWLVSLAPRGLIEFVPKTDPTIQIMLATRKDIFLDYTQENFETALSAIAKIKKTTRITESGRSVYEYQR